MQRYHFHFQDRDGLLPDEEGITLPDAAAAAHEAARQIREMVAQEVRETGQVVLGRRIEVSRSDGTAVIPIAFRAVITISD